MNLTDWTALFGAVGSTVAMTWNVLRELRDRKKLSIEIKLGYFINTSIPNKVAFITFDEVDKLITDKQIFLFLTIVNIGKQPINVRGWGGQLKKPYEKDSKLIFGPHQTEWTLPKLLQQSEVVNEYSQDLSQMNNIKKLWAYDSTNKHWKLSRRKLRRLLKTWERVKNETMQRR